MSDQEEFGPVESTGDALVGEEEEDDHVLEREVSSFRKRFAEAQLTDSLTEVSSSLITENIDSIAERSIDENSTFLAEMDSALRQLQSWKNREAEESRGWMHHHHSQPTHSTAHNNKNHHRSIERPSEFGPETESQVIEGVDWCEESTRFEQKQQSHDHGVKIDDGANESDPIAIMMKYNNAVDDLEDRKGKLQSLQNLMHEAQDRYHTYDHPSSDRELNFTGNSNNHSIDQNDDDRDYLVNNLRVDLLRINLEAAMDSTSILSAREREMLERDLQLESELNGLTSALSNATQDLDSVLDKLSSRK